MTSSHSNQREKIPCRGVPGVGSAAKRGMFRGTASKKKDSAYVTESDGSDAVILSLAGPTESWVIDLYFSVYFLLPCCC